MTETFDHTDSAPSALLAVQSPAKINLFLHILGKRDDGYHNLESLMCPVSLFDTLTFSFDGKDGIHVTCDHHEVPDNEGNLAWKAAQLFFDRISRKAAVTVDIQKRIPVAAGLGGGSSNAACVLNTLNRHFGEPLSRENLAEIGTRLGADIPFFIEGRPAVATGIGDKLKFCEGLVPFFVVLIAFSFGVSTAEVYKNLNLRLTKCEKINNRLPLERWGFDVTGHLCNDLEAVTEKWAVEIRQAKDFLLTQGAKDVLMSGSGPTVFGLFDSAEKAESVCRSLAGHPEWKGYFARMLV